MYISHVVVAAAVVVASSSLCNESEQLLSRLIRDQVTGANGDHRDVGSHLPGWFRLPFILLFVPLGRDDSVAKDGMTG